jgi:proline iminopeptidase
MRSTTLAVFAAALAVACERSASARTDSTTPAAASADSARPAAAPLGAGEAKLAVDGGSIWYKVSGTGAGTPLILLHGGPGYSSYYLKPIEQIGDDRKVVRYDQLGGGRSDGLTDTTKMTIAHFVAELDSLRSHLGYDRVHLLGHSWGTIVAVEYYRAHPERVASITLGSAALDIPAWEANARKLVKTLPDSEQKAIATREAEKKFDAPDYQHALEDFYGRYVWRRPVEADLDSTMKTANEAIYHYMQGPSEFTITGTLKKYDATPFLKSVKVPVLYTVGEYDEANPEIVKRFASMTPNAKAEVIPGAAHLTTWDNPTRMVAVVRDFLRHADSASVKR